LKIETRLGKNRRTTCSLLRKRRASLPSQPKGWMGPGNRQMLFDNPVAIEVASRNLTTRGVCESASEGLRSRE